MRADSAILHCLTCLICLIFSACASRTVRVDISSTPTGAEVVSFNGEKLGSTPLSLDSEQVKRLSESGRLAVTLNAPGYAERELVMEVRGTETYSVQLTKFGREYFTKKLLADFSPETNEMTRDLMKIMGLIVADKIDLAEKALQEFQQKFPNVAASYVLYANIEKKRKKPERAYGYLVRARELDPDDPVILRMLGSSGTSSQAPAPPPTTQAPPPTANPTKAGGRP